VTNLKFKPAYNPYTEPSMEIFSYHSGLKEWVEIGNSGMFRPEMLGPMGMPENVRVIAWGFGLERPAMIKYGYNDIRHLCGSGYDLELANKTPLFRFGADGHVSAVQQALAAAQKEAAAAAAAATAKQAKGAQRKGGKGGGRGGGKGGKGNTPAQQGKGKGAKSASAKQQRKPPAAAGKAKK
jgi:tRNA synthetases class II core domain (F)